jgi:tetratricopeptide (TPR) repeat protein
LFYTAQIARGRISTIKFNPNYVSAYYKRWAAYHNLGDHNKAIADCDQAIKLDPALALAYGNRALAYALLNDFVQAKKDARRACELGMCDALRILGKENLIRD